MAFIWDNKTNVNMNQQQQLIVNSGNGLIWVRS